MSRPKHRHPSPSINVEGVKKVANKKFEKFAKDRQERYTAKGPKTDKGGGRERNVGHPKGEKHSRVGKQK